MSDVGRNDPCPCGSGKKYKRCCLLTGSVEEVQRKKRFQTTVMVAIVAAIACGFLISEEAGFLVGAAGLAAAGIWQWMSAPPPKSGGGADPGAINFGR